MRNFQHTVPTMLKLYQETEVLLTSLPTEFSKKEFEEIRDKVWGNHPLSFNSCRAYGFIRVVRQEPATYKRMETVFTDPKGRQYTRQEIEALGRTAVEVLFDINSYSDRWFSIYQLPNADVEVEHPCYRNIFSVDWEKFRGYVK